MSFFRTASLYGNFRYSHTQSMLRSSNCHMPRTTKKILRLGAGSRNSYFTENPAFYRICRETERLIQAALVFFVHWTLHQFSARMRRVCSACIAFLAANNFSCALVQGAETRTSRKIPRLIEYAEIMKAACLCRSLLDFCRVAVGFYNISAALKALKGLGTAICCVYRDN